MSAPPPQPPAVCVCCKRISSCGLPSHQVCRASLADFWSFVIFPCYSLWSRSVCHSAQEALQHPGHCLNLWTCEIILRLFLTRYRNCLAFRHRDFMSHKVGKNFFFFLTIAKGYSPPPHPPPPPIDHSRVSKDHLGKYQEQMANYLPLMTPIVEATSQVCFGLEIRFKMPPNRCVFRVIM